MIIKKEELIDIFAGDEKEVMAKVDKIVDRIFADYQAQLILDFINAKKGSEEWANIKKYVK